MPKCKSASAKVQKCNIESDGAEVQKCELSTCKGRVPEYKSAKSHMFSSVIQ